MVTLTGFAMGVSQAPTGRRWSRRPDWTRRRLQYHGDCVPRLNAAWDATVNCMTPTLPAASTADCTVAGSPPMVTLTGNTGRGWGAVAGLPSVPAGEVCPSPVATALSCFRV